MQRDSEGSIKQAPIISKQCELGGISDVLKISTLLKWREEWGMVSPEGQSYLALDEMSVSKSEFVSP